LVSFAKELSRKAALAFSPSSTNNWMEKPMVYSPSRFVYVIYIRTTLEKLWQALIDPEFTRRYWNETWQESDWEPGSSWRILNPDGHVTNSGKILEIESQRRLVLSWLNEFKPELREEGYSRLTYEIVKPGASVKLTLIHESDNPDSKFIAAASEGWPLILASLKSLIETGEPLEETKRWPKGS
jgi:uncharacterized protein YndB with AHSA1/START domain